MACYDLNTNKGGKGLEKYIVINSFDQQNRIIRKVITTVRENDGNALTDLGYYYLADKTRMTENQNGVLVLNYASDGTRTIQELASLDPDDQNIYDAYGRRRFTERRSFSLGGLPQFEFESFLFPLSDYHRFMAGVNYDYPQPQAQTAQQQGPIRTLQPNVQFAHASPVLATAADVAMVSRIATLAPNFVVSTPLVRVPNGWATTITTVRSTIAIRIATDLTRTPDFGIPLLRDRYANLRGAINAGIPRFFGSRPPFYVNLEPAWRTPTRLLNPATGNLVNFTIRSTVTTTTIFYPNTGVQLRPF